jgi:hypothetical protein
MGIVGDRKALLHSHRQRSRPREPRYRILGQESARVSTRFQSIGNFYGKSGRILLYFKPGIHKSTKEIPMSLETELIEKIRRLPADKQLIVKSLVDELARVREQTTQEASKPWFGCLEHLGKTITEEDIAEARREMWGGFPREVNG